MKKAKVTAFAFVLYIQKQFLLTITSAAVGFIVQVEYYSKT